MGVKMNIDLKFKYQPFSIWYDVTIFNNQTVNQQCEPRKQTDKKCGCSLWELLIRCVFLKLLSVNLSSYFFPNTLFSVEQLSEKSLNFLSNLP